MAKEQLATTVYVVDPETHQTVTLEQGTCPAPRLAALVTNPAAWVDGKLPTAAKKAAESSQDSEGREENGPDGASGDDSEPATSAEPADTSDEADGGDTPAPAKKTAAKKAASKPPARGRAAADGDGSQ